MSLDVITMFDTQLTGPRAAGDIRGIPDIHDSPHMESFIFELNTVQVNITQMDVKTDVIVRTYILDNNISRAPGW